MSREPWFPGCGEEDTLILEIAVPGFNVEGIQAGADEFCDGDILPIVTDELMRSEVGVTFVTIPGEKCLNSDFEVHAVVCTIVGARIRPADVPAPAGREPRGGGS